MESPKRAAHAWDAETLRDPHALPDKAVRVEAMFDAVAPTYERVNRVASLGQDAAWRRRTIAASAVRPGDTVLDLCCGTGDMIRAFAAHDAAPAHIIGLDFSREMLAFGHFPPSRSRISLLRADALRVPLADQSVDIITCAFGIRNFDRLQVGLAEMHRLLRPGGRALILEFANPDMWLLRWAYQLYCERVLPLVAALISRDRTNAYRYLARSIRTFETTRSIISRLRDIGFPTVTSESMNLGGVVLFRAIK